VLSTSKNFLFVHIPKTAGNSIQNVLAPHSDDRRAALYPWQDGVERFEVLSDKYKTLKHSTLSEYQREYGAEMLSSLFKFCSVRNPWDRCVSFYFSPHRGPVQWDEEAFVHFVQTEVHPLEHYVSLDGSYDLKAGMRNIDFVVRFESLDSDFAYLRDRLSLANEGLPHRNASGKGDFRKYYNAERAELVGRLFRQEIEYFGYSF
jgi:hypothetical protein